MLDAVPVANAQPLAANATCINIIGWQQAYDIIMDENRALRSFEEAEVTEDPLVVLRCGHVLPMTSMDGYLELHHAYGMGGYGQWTSPLPLKVNSCCACLSDVTVW